MKTEEFCAWLREIRKEAGVTVSDLTKKYSWHRNTIGNYEKDRLSDIDYLYALSRETKEDLNLLLTARLKSGVLSDDPEISAEHFSLSDKLNPATKANPNTSIKCLPMPDNSMEPMIKEGAQIEVDTSQKELVLGKIYFIEYAGIKTVMQSSLGVDGIFFQQSSSGNTLHIGTAKDSANVAQQKPKSDRNKPGNNGSYDIIGRVISVKNFY